MSILRLENVSRLYASGDRLVTALDNVSLSLDAGQFVAVMGASGSGKSTLLNIAGTLDSPSSGNIYINDQPLSLLSAKECARLRRRTIGFVFQNFNLLPTLSVLDNVAFPLELDGMGRKAALEAAGKELANVQIEQLADRFPDQISGGQAQRVAIARSLVGPRQLLLADEPTGALDSETGETIMGVLRAKANDGAAVLLVTHEPRFAAWADRTIFLRDGRIIDASHPSNLDPQELSESSPS